MAKIESIGVISTNKSKTHKIEITVEFNEPVTFGEAAEIVLEALSDTMYDIKKGGVE